MGCSCKTVKVQPVDDKIIRTVNDIRIQPQQFILENDNSFLEVYKIGAFIGKGTVGKVYECVHIPTHTKRAVKILKKRHIENENLRNRLLQEISALRLLDHPNIIRILEYFEEPQKTYIVMELVKSEKLISESLHNLPYSEHEASFIMQQLFSAIAYSHSKSILSQNIRIEHILLENPETLQIKLVNFVNALHQSNGSVKIKKSFTRVAPEVLTKGYSIKSDL